MAEEIKTEEVKPKRKISTKKTTPKAEKVEAPASNPALEMLSALSPEQLAQLVQLISQPQAKVVEEPVMARADKPKKLTKAYLNSIRDKEVAVRNVCNGLVTFRSSKTQIVYKWLTKGDVEFLTISEVLAMNAQSPLFLNAPWLVVDDDEVVEALGLTQVKETIDVIDDLDSLFDESITVIKNTLNNLSTEHKHQVADQVSLKIQNKELRDIYIIRELQEILGKEFLIFNF